MAIEVRLFDGTSHSFDVRAGERVLSLRGRAAARTGIGANVLSLCCCGAVLSDDALLSSLPSSTVTAWAPRYSEGRAPARAQPRAGAERRASAQTLRSMLQLLREHGPGVVRSVPRGVWLRGAVWFALMLAARSWHFGMPFIIASLCWLMLTNLGTRRAGDASAYTIFNHGVALPGQLDAEDFDRELRHQAPREGVIH